MTPLSSGITVIEASAGTGKTFSLAGLFLRLIAEQHIAINQILAVTYTVAATAELKERIRHRLHEALEDTRRGKTDDEILRSILKTGSVEKIVTDLNLALQSFDEAQIFTIHGFCQRILRDHAFESGMSFDAELVTDPTPLFTQVARDFWRLKFYHAPPLVPALMLAWEQSPDEWIKILDRVRNHPGVVFIPPLTDCSFERLTAEIQEKFDEIRKEWAVNRAAIEQILENNGSLSRAKDKFSPPRVNEILTSLADVFGRSDYPDPISIRSLTNVTPDAISAGTKPTGHPPAHPFFELCGEFVELSEKLFLQLKYDFLRYADDELPRRKARSGIMNFDDLVLRLRNALLGSGGQQLAAVIGAKYKAALIDEFQDTDPAQYDIFQRIFGGAKHRLFYIGDPKQAIYGFRGADVFTYLKAAAAADRTLTLDTNWRSEDSLVQAVNDLFEQSAHPFVLPNIRYRPVHGSNDPRLLRLEGLTDNSAAPLQFRFVESVCEDDKSMNQTQATAAICTAVKQDILSLKANAATLGRRPVRFADMAILVRRNAQANQMQDVLREHGIPSIVQSEQSVFASDEARELQHLLQGILEPKRERLFKAALSTTLIGLNGNDLIELDEDEQLRQQWLDRFAEWQVKWNDHCFVALFRQILVQQKVRERIVGLPGGERRLTNLLHLAELLHTAETSERLQPESLCAWLNRERNKTTIAQDEYQLRLESDADAVQIITIHKCKGLEYPIVFCPFLWLPAESSKRDELQFHDRTNDDQLTISLRGKTGGTPEQRSWQTEEISSEEARMLYVAVTRAKNRCTIHFGDIKKIEESPLAQIFNRPANLAVAIESFASQSNGRAAFSIYDPETKPADVRPSTPTETLSARAFTGKIDRTAMVASFSGLNSGRIELQELAPEIADEPEPGLTEKNTAGDTIFDFPRGARSGDFFHAVLERLDFETAADLESLVDIQLTFHGLSKSTARDAVVNKLREMLDVQLEPGMSLKQVTEKKRLSELEFTYRLNRLDPARLRDVASRCGGFPGAFMTNLGRLRFDPVEGYLRGFIDLLFQFGDRYYIVDWKSNWLGNQPHDYSEDGMNRAMLEHNYLLQSHLYLLAADLFLQARVKAYDYEQHFGGIFYMFIRGVDATKPQLGVFRQKPEPRTINVLRELAL